MTGAPLNWPELVAAGLRASARVKEETARTLAGDVARVAALLAETLRAGRKVLVLGNGGSAADAQHFAGELVGRFRIERAPLPVLALTTDSSVLTAIGNDYEYAEVFARQVRAFARPGDLVVGISTSGGSENVVQALAAARAVGARTVALTGAGGGRLAGLADELLAVPSCDTPRVQEAHITIIHLLCELAEAALAGPR